VTLEDNLFVINFANRIGLTEANNIVTAKEALNNELFVKSVAMADLDQREAV
jgi:hypothetical protein